jgi:hypothetical protein
VPLLRTGNRENFARFHYTVTDRHTGEKTDYDYKVSLTTTPCNFGGVRYWFVCPLYTNGVYCGRSVGTLYLPPGGKYFGSRHCYDLSYESRNESRLGRFGQLGSVLTVERQMNELSKRVKRSFYAGRPTRTFRKLLRMQNRLNVYLDSPGVRETCFASKLYFGDTSAAARGAHWPR